MSTREYTPRGHTWKPCPGCHQEKLRKTDEVCHDCMRKIAAADAITKREAQRADVEEWFVPSINTFPSYYTKASNLAKHRQMSREISHALEKLVSLISVKPDDAWKLSHNGWSSDNTKSQYEHLIFRSPARPVESLVNTSTILLSQQVALTLRELDISILRVIRQAYDDGIYDGTRLLTRFASGDISVKQFNDATLQEEEEE